MGNHGGGGRAHFDRTVRFRAPNQDPKISLPPRPPKRSSDRNYPFNAGPDLSTIYKRFGSPADHKAPAPLKHDQIPAQLPVYKRKDEIVKTILASPVVIIEAETGSGKTTLVPQFLHEAGLKVTILGPRRLPASEVARFGAQMRNEELGDTIGFRHALDSAVSHNTKILYATEGYELARQLHKPMPADEVLIFDEFHERTANALLLLAHLKMQQSQGIPIPKIVIMSATLDSQRVSQYFGNVPIIKVEGRRYEVKELERGASPDADAVRFLNDDINPLSFHYGKKDIEHHIEKVRRKVPDAAVFPLHSKLPYAQQQAAIAPQKNKAVAATNTAQTSVTLDGMGAVILTGKTRRLVLDNQGVQSLIIDDISQDEFKQQVGRVGRTGPGVFVSHAKPFNELVPHAPSEIQNANLETLILRLEAAGINFSKINRFLYDSVKSSHIHLGYDTLHNLGLTGPQGHITTLGRRVAQLPIDARMGKLLVKAADYEREGRVSILEEAIRIAAVVEAEGILSGRGRNWQRLVTNDHSSDLKNQSMVYHRVLGLTPEQRAAFGIDEVNFLRARDIERMIRRRMGLPSEATPPISRAKNEENAEEAGKRESQQERENLWLSRAIIEAHVDSVFRFVARNEAGDYLYKPLIGEGSVAVLQKESVIGGARLIVGTRFNIGYLDGSGLQRIQPLLLNAHRLDDTAGIEWLETKAPGHLSHRYKDGISLAFRPSQKKQKGMVSRDFRGGKSTRSGRHPNSQHGH